MGTIKVPHDKKKCGECSVCRGIKLKDITGTVMWKSFSWKPKYNNKNKSKDVDENK